MMITANPHFTVERPGLPVVPEVPHWLASSIEAIGWLIYFGALSVLGSFAFILCLAVMRG